MREQEATVCRESKSRLFGVREQEATVCVCGNCATRRLLTLMLSQQARSFSLTIRALFLSHYQPTLSLALSGHSFLRTYPLLRTYDTQDVFGLSGLKSGLKSRIPHLVYMTCCIASSLCHVVYVDWVQVVGVGASVWMHAMSCCNCFDATHSMQLRPLAATLPPLAATRRLHPPPLPCSTSEVTMPVLSVAATRN